MKQLLIAAALFSFSLSAVAANAKPQVIKDVETLNDDIKKFSGKSVTVSGEIEDKIDSKTVVLESGGVFNDEIVVIAGPNFKGNFANLQEDATVMVTGTVVVRPIAEIRTQYTWDVTPDMQTEFRDVTAFLIADEVSSVKK